MAEAEAGSGQAKRSPANAVATSIAPSRRWFALIVLCLGVLMIVLDSTVVNVALPSIHSSLGFSETSLAWVINAYMLTFGGFLLLGGRLGDIYGPRRLFLSGLVLFTLASLACGLAQTQAFLIAARAVQGLGGAVVAAVALSLIMNLFPEPVERAKAMGVYGFVAAGGGSVGVVIGGLLTDSFHWHWIFLVNIPVGIAVFVLSRMLLAPSVPDAAAERSHDFGGALTITASIMLAVYAIVGGAAAGWTSLLTLGLLAASVVLFIAFLVIESSVRAPLVPLRLFQVRNVWVASVTGILWSAAMFAWFFLSALQMQVVLAYSPLEVGLAFLPGNLIMALFSLGLSARIVTRFGAKRPVVIGMALIAASLALFARTPVDGRFVVDILPGMIVLGLGSGIAFNPILLLAMSGVKQEESGLASGVLNTSFMLGGAVGLAILASLAAFVTLRAQGGGIASAEALTAGYQAAFLAGALFAASAALLGGLMFRELPQSSGANERETTA